MSEVNNAVIKACSSKLPKEWIKTLTLPGRPPLSYVSIDKTIKFFNDTFGDDWNLEIVEETWLPYEKPAVSIRVNLTIKGVTRSGIGSDIYKGKDTYKVDPDKLVKTAYANAFKKASNMFGFAAELWDESNVEDNSDENSSSGTSSAPVQEAPKSLSDNAKQYLREYRETNGLSMADMEEFLKEYKPESGGNPIILVHGNEKENVVAFCEFITGKIKS